MANNAEKHSIILTEYEYELLTKNSLISRACSSLLKPAAKHSEGIELSLTLMGLEELTGYVAAESNHAKSKRQSEDLGSVCDYLESLIVHIRRL